MYDRDEIIDQIADLIAPLIEEQSMFLDEHSLYMQAIEVATEMLDTFLPE